MSADRNIGTPAESIRRKSHMRKEEKGGHAVTHDEQRRVHEALGRAICELAHRADAAVASWVISYEVAGRELEISADRVQLGSMIVDQIDAAIVSDGADAVVGELTAVADTVADRIAREDWS